MTPHKQLVRHDPANGQYGDCERSSIACLLDMHPSEVPHWFDQPFNPDGTVDDADWQKRLDWLASRGLRSIRYSIFPDDKQTIDSVLAFVGKRNPDTWYLLLGRTAGGINHVVICKDDSIEWNVSDQPVTQPLEDGTFIADFIVRAL